MSLFLINILSIIGLHLDGSNPDGLVLLMPLAAPYNAGGTAHINLAIGYLAAAQVSPLTLMTKTSTVLSQNRFLRTLIVFMQNSILNVSI